MASHSPAHPSPSARVWQMIRAERADLRIAVAYSLVIGLLSLVVPIATQSLVNTVAFGTLLQPVALLTLIVFAALAFSGALQALRAWAVELIQRRFFVQTGASLVHRLLHVHAETFDRRYGPELVNRFLEVATVQKSSALLLIDGLSLCMQTALGMLLLAIYHPWLLAFDLFLLAAIFLVLLVVGRGAIPTSVLESHAKYAVVAWLEELARHLTAFRSSHAIAYAVRRADTLLSSYLDHRARHFRILIRQTIGFLSLQALAASLLLGVGAWLVIQRQLTIGQLVAAELVVSAILSSLAKFAKYLETYYDLAAAADKLGYLEDIPLEQHGSELLAPHGRGLAVRFKNVTYEYASGRRIISNANWSLLPGRHTGLSGATGQGKSTLLDLLYGLRSPSAGSIEIDGLDLRSIDFRSLRSAIALVRSGEIFHGSIEDNLRLGNPDASLHDLHQALAATRLLDEISALPLGLQTELSSGGRPLSSGQAVRLLLARAILARPRLLLLDEALDEIPDAAERDLLLDSLFDPAAPWTLLVATGDEAVLRRCDRVFLLLDGALAERR